MQVQPEVVGYISKMTKRDRHLWVAPSPTPFCHTPVVIIPEGCVVVEKSKLDWLNNKANECCLV